MAIKTSTGLAAKMLVTSSAKTLLDGGFIKVYGSAEPATADTALAGSPLLLWTISVNGDGTGLTWDSTAVGRSMVKPTGATWCGATTSGTAVFFRVVGSADDGLLSTTQPRIQGTCGTTADSDMYMSSTTIATNVSITAKSLSAFSITLPTN